MSKDFSKSGILFSLAASLAVWADSSLGFTSQGGGLVTLNSKDDLNSLATVLRNAKLDGDPIAFRPYGESVTVSSLSIPDAQNSTLGYLGNDVIAVNYTSTIDGQNYTETLTFNEVASVIDAMRSYTASVTSSPSSNSPTTLTLQPANDPTAAPTIVTSNPSTGTPTQITTTHPSSDPSKAPTTFVTNFPSELPTEAPIVATSPTGEVFTYNPTFSPTGVTFSPSQDPSTNRPSPLPTFVFNPTNGRVTMIPTGTPTEQGGQGDTGGILDNKSALAATIAAIILAAAMAVWGMKKLKDRCDESRNANANNQGKGNILDGDRVESGLGRLFSKAKTSNQVAASTSGNFIYDKEQANLNLDTLFNKEGSQEEFEESTPAKKKSSVDLEAQVAATKPKKIIKNTEQHTAHPVQLEEKADYNSRSSGGSSHS